MAKYAGSSPSGPQTGKSSLSGTASRFRKRCQDISSSTGALLFSSYEFIRAAHSAGIPSWVRPRQDRRHDEDLAGEPNTAETVAGADGAGGGELRAARHPTDNEAFRDVAAKVGRVRCGPFQRVFGVGEDAAPVVFGGEPVREKG